MIVRSLWIGLLLWAARADLRTGKIPPQIPVLLLLAGAVRAGAAGAVWFYAAGLLPGGALILLHLCTRGRFLGGGDVKLIGAAGLFLGLERTLWGLLLSCLLALCHWALRGRKERSLILGPWLALGFLAAELLGELLV